MPGGRQRVLLAGCGDLGTAVGHRLIATGHHVTGVRRRPNSGGAFEVRSMDLADPGSARLPQADAVVVALSADGPEAESYERAYRVTLRGLAAVLPQLPQLVVLVSSTGVLGDHHGVTVTEETEPVPTRATAEVLLRAEQIARDLFPNVGILRPAGIYGPGRPRTIKKVLNAAPADHDRMTNRIHRDDLVSTIVTVLEARDPAALLHAVDAEPARYGDVLRFLAHRLGVPVPPHHGAGEPRGRAIDATRLHRLLGSLAYPTYREGYQALLARDSPEQS